MSVEPWSERWEVIKENLGSGGQGKTSLVRSRADGAVAVMKRLKQQNDAERRKRMHREAEALRTLSHPGIPKLIDSNTSEFSGTIPLFIVIDHIDGPTLEAFVDKHGPLALADAVAVTMRLLEIVECCHDALVGHRDIKPDNLMLRGASKEDPVLIDFGLSFNFEPEDSTLVTGTEQQLGNRFLALPELTTPGSTKRDARSDFTSCVGIFYFLLSGYQPMTLRDADGKAPHERRDFARVLDSLPDRVRTLVTILFGRGFMYRSDDRYQDAAALRGDLETLLKLPTWPQGSERVRAAIERAQHRSSEANTQREASAEQLGDMFSAYVGPIRDALSNEVRKQAALGIPIREVPVSYTGWRSIAHRVLDGKHAHCFQYQCKAPGTRGFDVYLQVERGTGDGDAIARFTLFVTAPDHPWTGAHYLLSRDGRWVRQQHGPVEATEIVELALSWFDSEHLWERPEFERDREPVGEEAVDNQGIAAAARRSERERIAEVAEQIVDVDPVEGYPIHGGFKRLAAELRRDAARPNKESLLELLINKGGGGYNFLKLALELGVKPSEVRPLIEELVRAGEIELFMLNDDEVVYRLPAPVEPKSAVQAATPAPSLTERHLSEVARERQLQLRKLEAEARILGRLISNARNLGANDPEITLQIENLGRSGFSFDSCNWRVEWNHRFHEQLAKYNVVIPDGYVPPSGRLPVNANPMLPSGRTLDFRFKWARLDAFAHFRDANVQVPGFNGAWADYHFEVVCRGELGGEEVLRWTERPTTP